MSTGLSLDEASVNAVAQQVVELLRGMGLVTEELVDASEIARRFGVSTDYVYRHAEELGVVRLGDGKKPRLRFDPVTVRGWFVQHAVHDIEPKPQRESRRTVRCARSGSGDLLPIKGESP